MNLTWYTLRALAAEWSSEVVGMRLVEAYSQHRGELSIAFEDEQTSCTLVVVARPERRLLFRNPGRGRARKNTASLLEAAQGREVTGVRVAHLDRMLYVDLGDGLWLQIVLFGPRPNVWLMGEEGVVEAFSGSSPPPESRAAPEVDSVSTFLERFRPRSTIEKSVSRAMPLFDDVLAAEAVALAGLQSHDPSTLDDHDVETLFQSCREVIGAIETPRPRLYWRGGFVETFSLIPLKHLSDSFREEAFDSVDAAVRIHAHRTLGQERVERRFRPIQSALRRHAERLRRSADRMSEEVARPSRADEHERNAHLLMALAAQQPAGHENLTLEDIVGDGEPVEIPLDPALTAVENATRLYDRARRVRAARTSAERRLTKVDESAMRAEKLLQELDALEDIPGVEEFLDTHEDELQNLLGTDPAQTERLPYRRFDLEQGFQAWVGRSARDNATLTTRHARSHDLWLHARGVAGSHVIVRRERNQTVPRPVIEAAAAIAAHFSNARTSALVPVQVTERKFVRPLKGGPPGAMIVDREEVVLVEPRTP